MQRRYQSLQLHDAISRRNDYQEACRELRCIMRGVYVYAPEPFQAQLYQDVVHAFRTLPGMENSRQLEAAKALLQTMEELFPNKQQRASVAYEYETAVTARHQEHKNPEPPPECVGLSRDILLQVFKSLDARSLATASAVCREWNIAATDDSLWRTQFLYLFGSPNFSVNDVTVAGRQEGIHEPDQDYWKEQVLRKPLDNTVWLKAFNLAAKGQPSHLLTSNRACCSVCKEVIWLVEPAWKPAKGKCIASKQTWEHHSPRPMSVSQVVRYLVCKDSARAPETCSADSEEE